VHMRHSFLFAISSVSALAGVLSAVAQNAPAQASGAAETPQTAVVLTLAPTLYPPLARQARIMGEVKLLIGIRRDGTVATAEVISGHPMLKQAALDSAKQSTFMCEGCREEVTQYLLAYTFGFGAFGDCGVTQLRSAKCLYLWRCGFRLPAPARAPVVGQSTGRVIILADSPCVETTRSTTSQ
jgi:TonB family protein